MRSAFQMEGDCAAMDVDLDVFPASMPLCSVPEFSNVTEVTFTPGGQEGPTGPAGMDGVDGTPACEDVILRNTFPTSGENYVFAVVLSYPDHWAEGDFVGLSVGADFSGNGYIDYFINDGTEGSPIIIAVLDIVVPTGMEAQLLGASAIMCHGGIGVNGNDACIDATANVAVVGSDLTVSFEVTQPFTWPDATKLCISLTDVDGYDVVLEAVVASLDFDTHWILTAVVTNDVVINSARQWSIDGHAATVCRGPCQPAHPLCDPCEETVVTYTVDGPPSASFTTLSPYCWDVANSAKVCLSVTVDGDVVTGAGTLHDITREEGNSFWTVTVLNIDLGDTGFAGLAGSVCHGLCPTVSSAQTTYGKMFDLAVEGADVSVLDNRGRTNGISIAGVKQTVSAGSGFTWSASPIPKWIVATISVSTYIYIVLERNPPSATLSKGTSLPDGDDDTEYAALWYIPCVDGVIDTANIADMRGMIRLSAMA